MGLSCGLAECDADGLSSWLELLARLLSRCVRLILPATMGLPDELVVHNESFESLRCRDSR